MTEEHHKLDVEESRRILHEVGVSESLYFERGIAWQRETVWHDADKETPKPRSWILVSTLNPNSIAPVMALDSGILEADRKGLLYEEINLYDCENRVL